MNAWIKKALDDLKAEALAKRGTRVSAEVQGWALGLELIDSKSLPGTNKPGWCWLLWVAGSESPHHPAGAKSALEQVVRYLGAEYQTQILPPGSARGGAGTWLWTHAGEPAVIHDYATGRTCSVREVS